MITVKTERVIACAHRLPEYKGKCSFMHGHNFKVVVWVTGDIDQDGMVVDFTAIKNIIDQYDHKMLNEFEGLENPTAENLACVIANRIMSLKSTFYKVKVRVYESSCSYAEVIVQGF